MKTLVMLATSHPDKLSVVALATTRTINAAAVHHWRGAFFWSPWREAGADLLILKLTIVPLALLVFGIVDRLHGPRVAGWLAGFPIIAGPVLVFLALDHGAAFTAGAALGAYFGLVPWLAFTACYSWCSTSWKWLLSLVVRLVLWVLVAC